MPDSAVVGLTGLTAAGALATVAAAPAVAMGMTYVAGADSIGMAMANAVANQQRGQVLAQASLTLVLTLVITKGSSGS